MLKMEFLTLCRNAGGSTSDQTLELSSHIQNFSGLDVLMHLTCTYMDRDKILVSLDKVSGR
jgi:methylenetetrahydrofolate reductase (NADPH)